MPFCGECGTYMPDTAIFCGECGAKPPPLAALNAAGSSSQPAPSTPRKEIPESPRSSTSSLPPSLPPSSPSSTNRTSAPRSPPPSRPAPRMSASAPMRAPPSKPQSAPSTPQQPTKVVSKPPSTSVPPSPKPPGPPQPKIKLSEAAAEMEATATLLTLQKISNDLEAPPPPPGRQQQAVGVGGRRPVVRHSENKHFVAQLSREDLKGEGVYSDKALYSVRSLFKIFSYLPDSDALFVAAEVCKQWNIISESETLWAPQRAVEPVRWEKSLQKKKGRYNRPDRINIRIHTPPRARRSKDFVINVRKLSKLWSDFPMELRGFWAKQQKESVTRVLQKDHERSVADAFHTEGDIKCIIIDNGTSFLKAGFSAEKLPSLVVPSLLAYQETKKDETAWKGLPELRSDPEGNILLAPLGTLGCMVGPEAHNLAFTSVKPSDSKLLEKKQPTYRLSQVTTQNDEKQTWEDWGNMWSFVYNNLTVPGAKTPGVDPTQHPVLITQPIYAPRFIREKFTEMLFEQFNVPAVHITWAPVAAAYGYEINTGLCLDIGETSAQIVPIFEGTIVDTAMKRVNHLGGSTLTQYLGDHLHVRGADYFPGNPPSVKYDEAEWRAYQQKCVIRNVKEKLGRVATFQDYDRIVESKEIVTEYQPNLAGAALKPITVGREAYDCGEVWFQPQKLLDDADSSIVSLPEMIKQVVDACPLDIRDKVLSNIVLSGSSTMMPGFYERLEAEVRSLYKDTSLLAKSVSVKAALDRSHRVWIGGAELARLGMGMEHVWLGRDAYREYGAWGPESSSS